MMRQIWPERIQGHLGAAAESGYVAFDIAFYNGTDNANVAISSSFMIVTDLYGSVRRCFRARRRSFSPPAPFPRARLPGARDRACFTGRPT